MSWCMLQEIPIFTWHAGAQVLEKIYKPETADDWSGLSWGHGVTEVPSDTPSCGWDGEFCITPEPDITTPLAAGKRALTSGVEAV